MIYEWMNRIRISTAIYPSAPIFKKITCNIKLVPAHSLRTQGAQEQVIPGNTIKFYPVFLLQNTEFESKQFVQFYDYRARAEDFILFAWGNMEIITVIKTPLEQFAPAATTNPLCMLYYFYFYFLFSHSTLLHTALYENGMRGWWTWDMSWG